MNCITKSLLITFFSLSAVLLHGQQRKAVDTDTIKRKFTNPIYKGADPWMIKHNGMYYTCRSGNRGVIISESRFLTRREREVTVWKAPENKWNSFFIWAPELHHIDGKWYIYYAAGKIEQKPFIYQRTGVLMCDTPLGEYRDMGMLHTGDDPQQREEKNIWGIDMTVFKHKEKLYAVWSGWEQNADTDATDQHLYIAHMPTPTSIGKRILLTKATEPWEKGEHIVLVEGPSVIKHGGNTFIMYSTRGSWTPNYRMGQLRLKSGDHDPLNPASWEKSGPVFQGNARVLGVGHASFITSPDDTQNWIYYHTKTSREPGWKDRKSCLQQFYFDADGNPWFGAPIPAGIEIDRPSGEYEQEIKDLDQKNK